MIEGRTMGLSPKVAQQSQIEVDPKAADDYAVRINRDERRLRLQHSNSDGVISYHDLNPDEAYKLAQDILRGYDQLEGL